MSVKIIRAIFVLACCIMGGMWATYIAPNYYVDSNSVQWSLWVGGGAVSGAIFAGLILLMLAFITQERFERISPALVSIALALVLGMALGQFILDYYFDEVDPVFKTFFVASFVVVFGFVGVSIGLTRASNWESLIRAMHRSSMQGISPKLVDTSVIIDGRILDICATGFVEGDLLVPRFVLKELQNIADSSDVLRRARGRRGLDILKSLQDPASKVSITVIEDDPKDVREVDGKLVRLARDNKAKILTNDLNLNKVAQIEGVDVLNINDLANALKPAVLPDEHMHVKIVKEGKESYQGVGYLDDGTMIVVDGGREFLGKEVSVLVTSVLQTSAGRMIFSKMQSVLS
jgi:uncharacterized protein YacL